ncbi:MAG TPA: rhomboid family intramembrane serine protease [Opitutaceae bacterium]
MLSDRSYMRDSYARQTTSVLTWLICLTVAGFILQNVFWRWFGARAGAGFDRVFELSIPAIQSGQIWTLLTYSLLHSTGNFLHIIGNVLGMFFLGRELLPLLGSRRFLSLWGFAVLGGGLLWVATNWSHGGSVIGASAGVAALLVFFACLQPNQPMTFLLFFILPVTLKPKWIAVGLLAIDLFGFVFYEVLGSPSPMGFAHSAHLGGMAAGWLFFRFVHQRDWQNPDSVETTSGIELPKWFRRAQKTPEVATPAFKVNLTNREDLKAEVDRILDKINSEGFGALTGDEKRLLDDARDALSRR